MKVNDAIELIMGTLNDAIKLNKGTFCSFGKAQGNYVDAQRESPTKEVCMSIIELRKSVTCQSIPCFCGSSWNAAHIVNTLFTT